MKQILASLLVLVAASACDRAAGSSPPAPPAPSTSAPTKAAPPTPPPAAPAPARPPAAEPPTGMVYVPGGSFEMGMPADLTGGNPPVRTTVTPFFLDRLEVTTAAYLECVKAGNCEAAKAMPGCNASDKKPQLDHPINCITKPQAERYCAAQGKRLPSEAEWEFAARGSDGRAYPWGNEAPKEQLCWQGRKGAAAKRTCPVGTFPQGASPFGALDMSGNVAEWTASPETESAGPGAFRVRGGGYTRGDADPEEYGIRADCRRSMSGAAVFPDYGARCAKSL